MKTVGKDDKSIHFGDKAKVYDSFNKETNFIKVKIVWGQCSRCFNRIFRKKKYFSSLRSSLFTQLDHKICFFKNSKKYIPDVFLELDDSKETLRYLSDPVLFLEKIVNDIRSSDLSFFNRVFEKVGYPKIQFELPKSISEGITIDNVKAKSQKIRDVLEETKGILPSDQEWNNRKKIVGEEAGRLIRKEYGMPRRVRWIIDDFEKSIELLYEKRLVLFTEKAGQGKTNLVCDFVENFIKKKELLGVFLTGNEFNNLSRDTIESVIVKEVLGFKNDMSFNDFLEDIKVLCKQRNCPFTIVIDGVNENLDLDSFNGELYDFVERTIEYDFIRLIFTCRSEYFESRFSKFCDPVFKSNMLLNDNYLKLYRQHEELYEHLEDRLIQSYFSFFEVSNSVFPNVQKQLANDFLLLRIFCEVYGQQSNSDVPKEQAYDIFKDDLFKAYYEHKYQEINSRSRYGINDFKRVFQVVFEYMIENHQFINIPFTVLGGLDRDLLESIINEDIFFRKDLITDESSVFGNVEVLNFTFDEFRDYLLVDYLINSRHNLHQFLQAFGEAYEEFVEPGSIGRGVVRRKVNTALEGIEKYLFLKSRRSSFRERLRFIEQLEHYDDLFLENIFSVNDEFITEGDVHKVKELFCTSKRGAHLAISRLMYRHRINHYQNLNIFTLINIISELGEDSYNECINSYFGVRKKVYYHREVEGKILDLTTQLMNIVSSRDFAAEPELHNVMELFILLLGVDGREYGGVAYETVELLESYIEKYPTSARERLVKYRNINNSRIQVQIWDLLEYYVRESKHVDTSFIEMCFRGYEEIWNENIKKSVFRILKNCYEDNFKLFSEAAKDRFDGIRKEQEIDFHKYLSEIHVRSIRKVGADE